MVQWVSLKDLIDLSPNEGAVIHMFSYVLFCLIESDPAPFGSVGQLLINILLC